MGVRPGRREDSRTSVLVYPICGISTLHQDMFLEQLSCHSRLLESTAAVPLSLLLFISFSLALSLSPRTPSMSLESSCYKLTCGDNGGNIVAKRMVQVIPHPFIPVILGLIKYKIRGPERLPVLCGDTPTRSAFHNTSHIQPFLWTR